MATTKQQLINEVNAELSARRRIWEIRPDSTDENPVFRLDNYNRRYNDLLNVKKVLEQIPEHIIQRALETKPIDWWPPSSGQTELF